MTPIRIARVEAFAHRVPIATPIKVAFGTFRDRPVVLVRVTDTDGAEGWGEIWSNWPAVGAEHRARLATDLGERLVGRSFAEPGEAFHALTAELQVLVLQTGEVGPIAQVVAGIDIAIWDLAARRQGVALYRCLGGAPAASVAVYVTGLNPDEPEKFALPRQAAGHRAFKLKLGFGRELDLRNLAQLRAALGPQARLLTDANQALTLEAAIELSQKAAAYDIGWLEEPLRVDAPEASWRRLAAASPIPLAGGENLRGEALEAAARGQVLRVIQPDLTKWGGFTGNLAIARAAVERGKMFCPHVFGGGVALIAALHALAAVGGDGLLEFDCHPNAGRELVIGDTLPVSAGRVPVPQGPGLGVTPDLAAFARYCTWRPAG